jgi:hypothetical protein
MKSGYKVSHSGMMGHIVVVAETNIDALRQVADWLTESNRLCRTSDVSIECIGTYREKPQPPPRPTEPSWVQQAHKEIDELLGD